MPQMSSWSAGRSKLRVVGAVIAAALMTWSAAALAEAAPVQLQTLTVTKSGAGSGTVMSSPAGIDCGATCSAQFDQGTQVTLAPTPAAGSAFFGWSGACSGSGACVVTMDADASVDARFEVRPVAVFEWSPTWPQCNDTVWFNGSGSYHPNPARTIVSWDWDFGDTFSGSGMFVDHIYTAIDSYDVVLTVTDDLGVTGSSTQTLWVEQHQPSAAAGGPYTVNLGSALTLDGSGSSDPDVDCGDSIVSYEWDLDLDGDFDDAFGATPTVPWATLEALGLPIDTASAIQLRVWDSFGWSDDDSALLCLGACTFSYTERVSISTDGVEANNHSYQGSCSWYISADGRHVVFYSDANNLVPGDSNEKSDAFVRDRQEDTTSLVSQSSTGFQGDLTSVRPAVSANGRFVAFRSWATNLVAGDNNDQSDVFLRDRQTATTSRVSVSSAGGQSNGASWNPSISSDGRFVAFYSDANNLVSGDTNGVSDVFLHDRQTSSTERLSVATGGAQANGSSVEVAISGDGRCAVFESVASDLVPGDSNGVSDVFVRDRQTGTTTRASVGSSGAEGDGRSYRPSVSTDCRLVAFGSQASNLVTGDTNGVSDVFVHDLQTHVTKRVSVGSAGGQGNGGSTLPSLSSDGRIVAFSSGASNLVSADTNPSTDVFLHDRSSGVTTRASVSTYFREGYYGGGAPSLSGNGRVVAFVSSAWELVPDKTQPLQDVFTRGPIAFPAVLPLPAEQWRQIALPLIPPASPRDQIQELFGDDLTGVYGDTWRVYAWDELTSSYSFLPLSAALAPGQGYWIKRLAEEPGNRVTMTGTVRPLTPSSFFDIPLVGSASGTWNLVGHPFEFRVDWADVKVFYDGSEHNLAEADSAGKMSRVMFKWNGSAYQSYNGLTPGAMGTLDYWDGFWVTAYDAVVLRVYGTSTSGDRAAETRSPRGWYVRLTVATEDGFADPGNILGQLEGARVGFDTNDLEELEPHDGDSYLTIVFPHPEWREQAEDYTTDFRPLMAPQPSPASLQWAFEVRSGQPGRKVTLTWEGPQDVLKRSIVVDEETGTRIRPAISPEGYTFTLSGSARSLSWTVHSRAVPQTTGKSD